MGGCFDDACDQPNNAIHLNRIWMQSLNCDEFDDITFSVIILRHDKEKRAKVTGSSTNRAQTSAPSKRERSQRSKRKLVSPRSVPVELINSSAGSAAVFIYVLTVSKLASTQTPLFANFTYILQFLIC